MNPPKCSTGDLSDQVVCHHGGVKEAEGCKGENVVLVKL